jgi:hypothetical protein
LRWNKQLRCTSTCRKRYFCLNYKKITCVQIFSQLANCLPPVCSEEEMNGFIAQFALVDEEIVDHLSDFGGPVGVTGRNCGLGL